MNLFSDDIKVDDLDSAVKLLKESRAGFLTLFNNSPVCMSMTTTTLGRRTYVRVNEKFLEKFGFTEEEIIGKTSVEVGILDEEESIRVGETIRTKGRLQNEYVKCINKKREIVHTISSIEMMNMNDETHLVSFFIDITKIINQQAIIEQHVQQLEALNRELEAFSYTVSHDLQAPLRAVDNFTKILEEDYNALFDEDGKRVLDVIRNSVNGMAKLIDDLLAFGKLGKQELTKKAIDMAALIQKVLADLKKFPGHKAEINVGTIHPIKGDEALITQVVVNLISNAIKYSSKKEHPIITITSTVENNHVRYSIQDNGDGFDMQYADKLFGVFQRLHTKDQFDGTGVGLATVKRIIAKHGGTISAQGEVGKGATFSFLLPFND